MPARIVQVEKAEHYDLWDYVSDSCVLRDHVNDLYALCNYVSDLYDDAMKLYECYWFLWLSLCVIAIRTQNFFKEFNLEDGLGTFF
jgi:hypothetical protein